MQIHAINACSMVLSFTRMVSGTIPREYPRGYFYPYQKSIYVVPSIEELAVINIPFCTEQEYKSGTKYSVEVVITPGFITRGDISLIERYVPMGPFMAIS